MSKIDRFILTGGGGASEVDPRAIRIDELKSENARLRGELKKAEDLIKAHADDTEFRM